MGCTQSRCIGADDDDDYYVNKKTSPDIVFSRSSNKKESTKKCVKCRDAWRKLTTCGHRSTSTSKEQQMTVISPTTATKNFASPSEEKENGEKIRNDKKNMSSPTITVVDYQQQSMKNYNLQRSTPNFLLTLPDDDTLTKIIRCFPFAALHKHSTNSAKNTPNSSPRTNVKVTKSVHWNSFTSRFNNNNNTSNNSAKYYLDNAAVDGISDEDPTCLSSNSTHSALSIMVAKSLEATVPLVVPLETWLRNRLTSWVQLAGHDGTIVPASEQTLWKKRAANDSNECNAYMKLMDDLCCPLVPRFIREVEYNGELFIEIEDLMRHFDKPAIMDVKLGTRTFLESEVTNPVTRSDLYLKMVQLDPSEPTDEENAAKAITKLRYMQERYGNRLNKDFKKVKTRDQVMDVICRFLGPKNENVRAALLERLTNMRSQIERSEFFRTHEVVGSSLLIMYDDKHASSWLIDFAKALPLDSNMHIDHRTPWRLGNHEDGCLFGLDNFIQVLEDTKLREVPLIV